MDTEKHEEALALSRQAIEKFASSINMSYEKLMGAAKRYLDTGDSTNMGSNESYSSASTDEWDQFWEHYAVLNGQRHAENWAFFSCAC